MSKILHNNEIFGMMVVAGSGGDGYHGQWIRGDNDYDPLQEADPENPMNNPCVVVNDDWAVSGEILNFVSKGHIAVRDAVTPAHVMDLVSTHDSLGYIRLSWTNPAFTELRSIGLIRAPVTGGTKSSKDFGTVGAGNFDSVLRAKCVGVYWDAVTVALVGDASAGVQAEKDFSTVAPGNFDTVVQAVNEGSAGNSITVRLLDDGATGVKSSKDFGTVGSFVFDSVIEAYYKGSAWDDITITLAGRPPDAGGVLITRLVNAFTISYESGVSTVLDVENAIGALSGGDLLIAVQSPGTPGSTLTSPGDDSGPTNLAGGVDGAAATITRIGTAFTIHCETLFTTVGEIEAAITALAGADKLIQVKSSGTTGRILLVGSGFVATPLSGGHDGAEVIVSRSGNAFTIHFDPNATTVAQVEAAIGALTGADLRIEVATPGTAGYVLQAGDAFGATHLAGGADGTPDWAHYVKLAGFTGIEGGALPSLAMSYDDTSAVAYTQYEYMIVAFTSDCMFDGIPYDGENAVFGESL